MKLNTRLSGKAIAALVIAAIVSLAALQWLFLWLKA
jgi:hypothetical protein